MSSARVRAALRERRLHQRDLAAVAGMPQQTLSAVLSGYLALDAERKARIEAAISELGLARELPPNPSEPVFEVKTSE